MTEDELAFAVSIAHKDLVDAEAKLVRLQSALEDLRIKTSREELVISLTQESLASLVKAQVVSAAEYKRLRNSLKTSRDRLAYMLETGKQTVKTKNKAAAELPALRKQLEKLESQLQSFEPVRTVLEFRHREKQ